MNTPDADNSVPSRSRAHLFWPGLVVALLGGQVLLLLGMAYLATRDQSFAVEPDYYQKALHWDATAAQLRDNARLGWSIELALDPADGEGDQQTLRCTLTNRDGQPLEGAAIDLVAFPHVRAEERSAAVMVPVGDGRYETPLHFAHKGLWEFRFSVRRGPETFTCTETCNLFVPDRPAAPRRPAGGWGEAGSARSFVEPHGKS